MEERVCKAPKCRKKIVGYASKRFCNQKCRERYNRSVKLGNPLDLLVDNFNKASVKSKLIPKYDLKLNPDTNIVKGTIEFENSEGKIDRFFIEVDTTSALKPLTIVERFEKENKKHIYGRGISTRWILTKLKKAASGKLVPTSTVPIDPLKPQVVIVKAQDVIEREHELMKSGVDEAEAHKILIKEFDTPMVISEEVIEPNTEEVFYQSVIANIDPFDNWHADPETRKNVENQIWLELKGGTVEEREKEAKRIYDRYLTETLKKEKDGPITPPVPKEDPKPEPQFDIRADPKTLKDYYLLNKSIENFLKEKGDGEFSPEEKQLIARFSGYGGLQNFIAIEDVDRKILYEYFTPEPIVERMWGLAYKYGYKGGPVLDPAAGTGNFLQYAPRTAQVTAYEINPVSAKILKILYPNTDIVVGKFENAFIENRKSVGSKVEEKYDLVIGNPPFGVFSGMEAAWEKPYTKATNYADYFILRSLDLLKPGGLLVFIIGVEVSAGGKPFLDRDIRLGESKELIQRRSKLIDAYRLPNGVFDRTDVLTDIIVLQKK